MPSNAGSAKIKITLSFAFSASTKVIILGIIFKKLLCREAAATAVTMKNGKYRVHVPTTTRKISRLKSTLKKRSNF